ncbi:hypothetical protein VQ643_06210 [Pseudomonas sp. F1_0610]|uniref:hypothetical protein n=1 Tax=Pseudomonas sp. F1_0610 TaxID=3114284 RepID=UPI0039C05119
MLNLNGQTHRRLAEAMQQAMLIPEGDELVFVIGRGNESSNLEALETWVKESLDVLEDDLALAVLPLLLNRLGQTINHWSPV